MANEIEFKRLQRRVQLLEKKLKSWSRIFRMETIWKHNLEEWLIQHFDYNVRLQTELSFFKSSDEEDNEDSQDDSSNTPNKTNAVSVTPNTTSFKSRDACNNPMQNNPPLIQNYQTVRRNMRPVDAILKSQSLKRKIDKYGESDAIEIGSTTLSPVDTFHTGKIFDIKSPKSIRRTNEIEVPCSSTGSHLQMKNSNMSTLPLSQYSTTKVSYTNTNENENATFEFEIEEKYDPACNMPQNIHNQYNENEEISNENSNRTFTSDTVDSSDIVNVSDADSDSDSVIFIDEDIEHSLNSQGSFTHQCITCGRKVAPDDSSTTPLRAHLENTVCFVCRIEQVNRSADPLNVDKGIFQAPQKGKIEIWANTGIEMDAKSLKLALMKSASWNQCAVILIRGYFPRIVLRRSNAKGGERKIPGGNRGEKHDPLDETVINIFKKFVKHLWMRKGALEMDIENGFNRIINKVCQRERDKFKRQQMLGST